MLKPKFDFLLELLRTSSILFVVALSWLLK